MLPKIILICMLGVIAFSFIVYSYYQKTSSNATISKIESKDLYFKHPEYNFQIQYPPSIKIGYVQEGYIPVYKLFEEEPFVTIETNSDQLKKDSTEYEQSFEEFATFISGCAADSESASLSCEVKQIKEITTDSGINGLELIFDKTLIYNQDNRQERGTFGPVYIFDISKQTNYKLRTLKIAPTIASKLSETDIQILEQMAKSLTFD